MEESESAMPLEGCEAFANSLLDAIRNTTQHDLSHYSHAVRVAFRRIDPVFVRRGYSEFFFHCATSVPGWLQRVILLNAKGESEGAEGLVQLWQGVTYNDVVSDAIMEHARDESRHSRMFGTVVSKTFPDFLTEGRLSNYIDSFPDIRQHEHQKADEPLPEEHLIDHLVQMNIGEIRTRLHMHLFAPIVMHLCPEENRRTVRKHLEVLARDEMRHISYTAQLMEQWSEDGWAETITQMYLGRLNTFHKITIDHTRASVEQHGEGRFPNLLAL